jgi:hypothetical protein
MQQSETATQNAGAFMGSNSSPITNAGRPGLSHATRDGPPKPANIHGPNTSTNIVVPTGNNMYVIFGVTIGTGVRLAQIDVQGFTDDRFFEKLKREYTRIRGSFRQWLSLWRYHHCDFVKFEKFDDQEVATLELSMPEPTNKSYHYKPKPVEHMPPISPHEFYRRFHSCCGSCKTSKTAFPRFPHYCKKTCRRSMEALERIPKRTLLVEILGDSRDIFWGIHAVERLSFFMTAIYHILILAPPLIFWFLWLFQWGHSGDLQNAAVPFLSALGLVSLFWFPLLNK